MTLKKLPLEKFKDGESYVFERYQGIDNILPENFEIADSLILHETDIQTLPDGLKVGGQVSATACASFHSIGKGYNIAKLSVFGCPVFDFSAQSREGSVGSVVTEKLIVDNSLPKMPCVDILADIHLSESVLLSMVGKELSDVFASDIFDFMGVSGLRVVSAVDKGDDRGYFLELEPLVKG